MQELFKQSPFIYGIQKFVSTRPFRWSLFPTKQIFCILLCFVYLTGGRQTLKSIVTKLGRCTLRWFPFLQWEKFSSFLFPLKNYNRRYFCRTEFFTFLHVWCWGKAFERIGGLFNNFTEICNDMTSWKATSSFTWSPNFLGRTRYFVYCLQIWKFLCHDERAVSFFWSSKLYVL